MYLKQPRLLAVLIALAVGLALAVGYAGFIQLRYESFIGCGYGIKLTFGCFTWLGLFFTAVLFGLAALIGLLLRRFSAY
jgi:hypothetical protein